MRPRIYRYVLIAAACLLAVSSVAAQSDKQATRQRAALATLLAAGEEAVEVGDLLQNEDFGGGNSWDEYDDDGFSVGTQDGIYRMYSEGNFYIWALDNQEQADVIIEVDTNQVSKDLVNSYGIICRADTEANGNGYYFSITADGYYTIQKGTDDGLENLVDWAESDAINQGRAENSIVAVCVGSYLALYANGELLVETNDDSYSEGYGGLTVGTFEDEATVEIEFDNLRVWGAGGSSSGLGTKPTAELALNNFGGDSEDTIAELEALGLIPSGSTFIFGEDYAFFTGQGSWFTSLASNKPASNIVFGGELTFTVGSENDLEVCALTARIDRNSQGDAITYIDIGLINDGRVALIDRFSEAADSNVAIGDTPVDLDEPHHFVALLIDDRANVFVDGALAIADFEIDRRAGTYGITLQGEGPEAKCEGRDIWAYQVLSASAAGECVVTSGRDVNKRSGPGTEFDSPGQLLAGQEAIVMGQATGKDGLTWWQLDDDTWVREDVVSLIGECSDVPIIKR